MPNLLEGPSPLKIGFAVSLPHSLLATMGLVCADHEFEGLGGWLRDTDLRMSPELRDGLCLLIRFAGGYQRFTSELIARLPEGAAELRFDALLVHLETIPDVHYQLIALRALARGASPRPSSAELLQLLDQPDRWAAYLADAGSSTAPETVAALVSDGAGLKSRLLTVLERFWREHYADEFAATRPLMERSVAHHRAQYHSPRFPDLFTAVTGRLVPEEVADLLPAISTVTCVPSCYVGPYVAYNHFADNLILYYNCRSTPPDSVAVNGSALYPPLKALADETRLQILDLLRGRELYAQEIVEQLDISQPAVSRHLNLMIAAGVLDVRRDGNAKYYTINGRTLTDLSDTLRGFV